ncbi:hypothetical protein D1BOALGB6SA_1783 [Olavius sp. associated proteobacterium Delta 1]|nr:hypothetical protein D1BOALGB6SA_1783 [Olavius sp. associated proteobacterium Delta 1]
MITDSFFDLLDLDHDGNVSRSELHTAATRLGWHWYEAPILALLDLLTLREPIPRKQFKAIIQQTQKDPMALKSGWYDEYNGVGQHNLFRTRLQSTDVVVVRVPRPR